MLSARCSGARSCRYVAVCGVRKARSKSRRQLVYVTQLLDFLVCQCRAAMACAEMHR